MGFTGLYTKYFYFSWFIFVFKHKSGAYDYYDGREERCGWRATNELISIHLLPSNAKLKSKQLNDKLKEK